jgi:hypothetical protein
VATPTLRGTATTATSASASFTCAKPTGVVAGDILISLQFTDLGVGSTPSGWTQLRNYTADIESRLAWKVAGSSEPASYTFSQSTGGIGGGAIVIALQGASTSTPVSAVGSTGSGSTVTTPSVNPDGGRVHRAGGRGP